MTRENKKQDSFAREVGRGLVEEAKDSVRSAAIGAVLGSAVLGGAGFYYFGLYGLLFGGILGAVIGGGIFWFAHMNA